MLDARAFAAVFIVSDEVLVAGLAREECRFC